jgi:hypothetical protein
VAWRPADLDRNIKDGWVVGVQSNFTTFFDEKKTEKVENKKCQSGERRRPLNLNLFIFYLLKKLEL